MRQAEATVFGANGRAEQPQAFHLLDDFRGPLVPSL